MPNMDRPPHRYGEPKNWRAASTGSVGRVGDRVSWVREKVVSPMRKELSVVRRNSEPPVMGIGRGSPCRRMWEIGLVDMEGEALSHCDMKSWGRAWGSLKSTHPR